MDEDYINDVPAIDRKVVCPQCGKTFYKQEHYQEFCDDCTEDINSRELKEDAHFAERAEQDKQSSFSESRGLSYKL